MRISPVGEKFGRRCKLGKTGEKSPLLVRSSGAGGTEYQYRVMRSQHMKIAIEIHRVMRHESKLIESIQIQVPTLSLLWSARSVVNPSQVPKFVYSM